MIEISPRRSDEGVEDRRVHKRRIYSPFVSDDPEDDEYDKDLFDQFGDFGDGVPNALRMDSCI